MEQLYSYWERTTVWLGRFISNPLGQEAGDGVGCGPRDHGRDRPTGLVSAASSGPAGELAAVDVQHRLAEHLSDGQTIAKRLADRPDGMAG
jgi:hypothetical protein